MAVPGNPRLDRIVEQLRASRFAELNGARASASIPLSERLLNDILAAVVPASAPVRDVSVQPKAGNRLRVSAKLARADFLPPISLTLEIERQSEPPSSPLVLRVLSFPGLMALAGAAFSMATLLPPGIRLEGQRLHVDVGVLLERHGYGEMLPHLESLQVSTEEGRLVLDVSLRVGAART